MPGTEQEEQRTDQNAGEETQSGQPVSDDDLNRAWEETVSGKDRQEAPAPEKAEGQEQQQEAGSGEEAAAEGEAQAAVAEGEAEEAEGEVSAEAPETPEKKPDPEHPTRLGRKVKELSDTVSEQQKQITELLGIIRQGMTPKQEAATHEAEEIDLTTPEGIEHYLELRERKKSQAANQEVVQYQTGYKGSLDSWREKADEADETYSAEVFKLLTDPKSPFNVKHSSDPGTDFERNLAKAEAHYWREKAKAGPERKNPLEANRAKGPKAPTAVGGPGRSDPPKSAPTIKFTAEERELIAGMGMSEEDAAKFLTSTSMPMHLQPGRAR